MKSMREQILDAVETADAISTDDLMLAFTGRDGVRKCVMDMIDDGALVIDIDFNLVLGDGVALWP